MKKALVAIAMALVIMVPARAQHSQAPIWLQRLQRWLEAVERHQPGTDDGEARLVATWPRTDLRTLLGDLLELRRLIGRAWQDSAPLDAQVIIYGGHQFEVRELQQLLRLTDDEARRGVMDRILWAGALLHTDVAMLVASEDRPIVGQSMMVRLLDGQPDGYEYPVTAQWEFARGLLDALHPEPGGDETVLAWYRATASYLLTTSLSDAAAQLDRGRKLFPGDAYLLFLRGCVEEAYASSRLQTAIHSAVLPPGRTIQLESSHSYLVDAEAHFRKAIEIDPRLTEARLRLGRVIGVLGRHQDAIEELGPVAAIVGDSRLVYCASLFLGEEEQAMGHRDAARDWYERAASVYPHAQSPLFALSNLALRSGDTAQAMRAVDKIRGLPAAEDERADPWLEYYVAGGHNARALLHDVLAAVPRGPKQ